MRHETNGQDLWSLWQRSMEQGLEAWSAVAGPSQPPNPLWQFSPGRQASPGGQAGAGAPDVLAQWKRAMDDAVEAWSSLMENAMAREEFAAAMGRCLDAYLNAIGPLRRSLQNGTEEFSRALNLPTRKQVTSLAAQIVAMDARLEAFEDRTEDQLERMAALQADRPPRSDTSEAEPGQRLGAQILAMDARLEAFEHRIGELLQRIASLQGHGSDAGTAAGTPRPRPRSAKSETHEAEAGQGIGDAAEQTSQASPERSL